MHICFVEKGYPGPSGGGGAGTFVQVFAKELIATGHQVTVVAQQLSTDDETFEEDGIRIIRPRFRGGIHYRLGKLPGFRLLRHSVRYLEGGRNISRILDKLHADSPFDLVEFSEGGDYFHHGNNEFVVVSHLHGSRYTFLKQSSRPVDRADWWQRRLELKFIRSADWVFSPSRAMLDTVSEEAGRPFAGYTILPYPLDRNQLEVNAQNDNARSPVTVMFSARNDPVKGADLVLEAAARIVPVRPNVRFELFGYVPKPGETIPKGVVVNDFVNRHDLLLRLRGMDICVVPSRWDNSPNTVYEAMAAGKPVVASAVGGIPEIVIDGSTGLLFPRDDCDALAAMLLRLIDDPGLRSKMGGVGRARILELSEPTRNSNSRLSIYRDLLGHCRKPQR